MSVIPDPTPARTTDDDIVTVQTFAQQYRVDESIVRGWVKKGYINWELVGPRHMKRIRKSDIVKPIAPSQPHGRK